MLKVVKQIIVDPSELEEKKLKEDFLKEIYENNFSQSRRCENRNNSVSECEKSSIKLRSHKLFSTLDKENYSPNRKSEVETTLQSDKRYEGKKRTPKKLQSKKF